METKQCRKCGEHKPIETYDWSDRKRGYKKTYCRECSVKTYYKWKIDNRAKHDAWFEEYYKNNPHHFGITNNPKGRPAMEPKIKSGVYLLTNTETGETYVGCSNDVKRRIWRHFYNRGRSKSKELARAFKQYGKEAFTSQVLEYCENTIKFEREAYWMTQYGCEYNRNKADKK